MSKAFDIVETIADILKQEFRRENVDVSTDPVQTVSQEANFTGPVEILVKLGSRFSQFTEKVDAGFRLARADVYYFHRDVKKVLDAEERGLEVILEAGEDFRKIGIDLHRVIFNGTTDEATQAGAVRGMPPLLKQTWDITYPFSMIDRTPITGGGVSPGGGPVSPPANGGTSPPSTPTADPEDSQGNPLVRNANPAPIPTGMEFVVGSTSIEINFTDYHSSPQSRILVQYQTTTAGQGLVTAQPIGNRVTISNLSPNTEYVVQGDYSLAPFPGSLSVRQLSFTLHITTRRA